MNIRHDRRSAAQSKPIRFVLPAKAHHPQRADQPAHRLLDPQLERTPSVAELAWLVGERMAKLYPGLPNEPLARAARQGAEKVLAGATPEVAAVLPELALREARGVISLYLALAEQNHLRLVA